MATQKATSKDNKNQLQDQNRSMSLPPSSLQWNRGAVIWKAKVIQEGTIKWFMKH